MGCDIHVIIEVKRVNSLDWEFFYEGSGERDYELFARLADVRNEEYGHKYYIEPIDEPRGLPDDASELAKTVFGMWGSDIHSISYLTLDELVDLEAWWCTPSKSEYSNRGKTKLFNMLFRAAWIGPFGPSFKGMLQEDDDTVNFFSDFRLLFGFDN